MPTREAEPPHATHEGVLKLGNITMRVYRLSNGQAVIHEDDMRAWMAAMANDARPVHRRRLEGTVTPTREQLATRPESGPMQFGDDWPGIFLRGDDACWLGYLLARVAEGQPLDAMTLATIGGYARRLQACDEKNTQRPEPQRACLATPPPEPQAMPPIEVGDWLNLATEYRTDVMRIRSGYGRVSSDIEADAFNQRGRWHVPLADQQPPDITEIRKANGTVWTREPRR